MSNESSRPVLQLSRLDKFLLDWIPSYGRSRLMNKVAIAQGVQQGFITPGSNSPSMMAWTPTGNPVEYDTLRPMARLRAGSRDMAMNTPVALAALRRLQTNVVGFGLIMQSRIDAEYLGLTPEQAQSWQRQVETEWRYWSESKECDVRRTSDFYELQALAFFSELVSGDVFVLLPEINRVGQIYDMRVQLIESDFISNPNGVADTFRIAGGVEVDSYGAPVAYHLKTIPEQFKNSPVSSFIGEWKRLSIFGEATGRRNILHLFRPERPGQRRGLPIIAPVIEPIKNLTRLSSSELQAAVVASLFTVFIKNTPTGGLSSGFIPSQDVTEGREDAAKLYQMGPGSVIGLDDNQSIEIAEPKRPNGAFEPFFRAIVQQIGAALEIPYEQLMLSYTASYSASRGAVLEAWKAYKTHRHRVARNYCQPVYETWLMEAVLKGRIRAPGFLEDPVIRAAWSKAKWTGPGQGMLNPEAEANAKLKLIDGGLSTYEDEYTELHGGDWDGAIRRRAQEQRLKDELGLKSSEDKKAEAKALSNPNKEPKDDLETEDTEDDDTV